MNSRVEEKLKELELRFTSDDLEPLKSDLEILGKHNLSEISCRLLRSTKPHKFLECLTEIKFTAQLLKSLLPTTIINIQYEPGDTKRPIDLVIDLNNKKYLLQIKSLSQSIRDSKKSQILREIRRQVKDVKCKRGIYLYISDNFIKEDVTALVSYVSKNLSKNDGEEFEFISNENHVAKIEFKTAENPTKDHLVVYSFSDLDVVNITGITQGQVKQSLENAAGAFETNSSKDFLNLIISEIRQDRQQAIDFASALYGTEYSTFKNGKMHTHRDSDGLFLEKEFANKVAGVIVLYRKEQTLSSHYLKVICVNPFFDYLNSIKELIQEDKIIERYTWIDGGFFS